MLMRKSTHFIFMSNRASQFHVFAYLMLFTKPIWWHLAFSLIHDNVTPPPSAALTYDELSRCGVAGVCTQLAAERRVTDETSDRFTAGRNRENNNVLHRWTRGSVGGSSTCKRCREKMREAWGPGIESSHNVAVSRYATKTISFIYLFS